MYEYYHHEDIPGLADAHKTALLNSNKITSTLPYRMRSKQGNYIRLQSEWKSFKNPWTKDVEYLISKNTVVLNQLFSPDSKITQNEDHLSSTHQNFNFFNQSANNRDIQTLINNHVETSKIGSKTAEEILESQRTGESSSGCNSVPDSPDLTLSSTFDISTEVEIPSKSSPIDKVLSENTQVISRPNGRVLPHFSHVRNNITLASVSNRCGSADDDMMEIIETSGIADANLPNTATTMEGNNEAAMAVLMSLLEADAGLGGPVDYTGIIPWSMP